MGEEVGKRVPVMIENGDIMSLEEKGVKVVIGGANPAHELSKNDFRFKLDQPLEISRQTSSHPVVIRFPEKLEIAGVYLSKSQKEDDLFSQSSWEVGEEGGQVIVKFAIPGQTVVLRGSGADEILAIETLGENNGPIQEVRILNQWDELAEVDRKVR